MNDIQKITAKHGNECIKYVIKNVPKTAQLTADDKKTLRITVDIAIQRAILDVLCIVDKE